MYTLHAFNLDQFGEISGFSPNGAVSIALRQWMLHKAICDIIQAKKEDSEPTTLVDEEIHNALEHYFTSYVKLPEEPIKNLTAEMRKYYFAAFEHFRKENIVDSDLTSDKHKGVFIIIKD